VVGVDARSQAARERPLADRPGRGRGRIHSYQTGVSRRSAFRRPGGAILIGQTLAHYRITAAIGAGGMGEVFRATDTKLGREVALKVLPAEMASDPDRLARFQREAKALAALDHPGIVGVYSVEEAGASTSSPCSSSMANRSTGSFRKAGFRPIGSSTSPRPSRKRCEHLIPITM
jgi:serine/threonine protein kinase